MDRLERIKEIKQRKPFAVWDILIYGLLALMILVLFCVFVFFPDKTPLRGISFVYHGEEIFTYTFDEKKATPKEGWENRFSVEEKEDGVYVTFYDDDEKSEYNILKIDLDRRTAKMTTANCSRSKDCTYMEAISTVSQTIICVPHALKILPIGVEEDYSHPSLG